MQRWRHAAFFLLSEAATQRAARTQRSPHDTSVADGCGISAPQRWSPSRRRATPGPSTSFGSVPQSTASAAAQRTEAVPGGLVSDSGDRRSPTDEQFRLQKRFSLEKPEPQRAPLAFERERLPAPLRRADTARAVAVLASERPEAATLAQARSPETSETQPSSDSICTTVPTSRRASCEPCARRSPHVPPALPRSPPRGRGLTALRVCSPALAGLFAQSLTPAHARALPPDSTHTEAQQQHSSHLRTARADRPAFEQAPGTFRLRLSHSSGRAAEPRATLPALCRHSQWLPGHRVCNGSYPSGSRPRPPRPPRPPRT